MQEREIDLRYEEREMEMLDDDGNPLCTSLEEDVEITTTYQQ